MPLDEEIPAGTPWYRAPSVGEAPPQDHTENDNPVRIKIEAPKPMGLLP
jgi:hypothetical protein